jgi:acyl-CoA reductase-like NAD-dependent aldehyde dehydrogenase
VINLLTGDGRAVSDVVLADPHLAGIHFTGSTATFRHLWQQVGANLAGYRAYPRLVGETGGKDFVLAHPSGERDVLRSALVRGAFEYLRIPGPEVLGSLPRLPPRVGVALAARGPRRPGRGAADG